MYTSKLYESVKTIMKHLKADPNRTIEDKLEVINSSILSEGFLCGFGTNEYETIKKCLECYGYELPNFSYLTVKEKLLKYIPSKLNEHINENSKYNLEAVFDKSVEIEFSETLFTDYLLYSELVPYELRKDVPKNLDSIVSKICDGLVDKDNLQRSDTITSLLNLRMLSKGIIMNDYIKRISNEAYVVSINGNVHTFSNGIITRFNDGKVLKNVLYGECFKGKSSKIILKDEKKTVKHKFNKLTFGSKDFKAKFEKYIDKVWKNIMNANGERLSDNKKTIEKIHHGLFNHLSEEMVSWKLLQEVFGIYGNDIKQFIDEFYQSHTKGHLDEIKNEADKNKLNSLEKPLLSILDKRIPILFKKMEIIEINDDIYTSFGKLGKDESIVFNQYGIFVVGIDGKQYKLSLRTLQECSLGIVGNDIEKSIEKDAADGALIESANILFEYAKQATKKPEKKLKKKQIKNTAEKDVENTAETNDDNEALKESIDILDAFNNGDNAEDDAKNTAETKTEDVVEKPVLNTAEKPPENTAENATENTVENTAKNATENTAKQSKEKYEDEMNDKKPEETHQNENIENTEENALIESIENALKIDDEDTRDNELFKVADKIVSYRLEQYQDITLSNDQKDNLKRLVKRMINVIDKDEDRNFQRIFEQYAKMNDFNEYIQYCQTIPPEKVISKDSKPDTKNILAILEQNEKIIKIDDIIYNTLVNETEILIDDYPHIRAFNSYGAQCWWWSSLRCIIRYLKGNIDDTLKKLGLYNIYYFKHGDKLLIVISFLLNPLNTKTYKFIENKEYDELQNEAKKTYGIDVISKYDIQGKIGAADFVMRNFGMTPSETIYQGSPVNITEEDIKASDMILIRVPIHYYTLIREYSKNTFKKYNQSTQINLNEKQEDSLVKGLSSTFIKNSLNKLINKQGNDYVVFLYRIDTLPGNEHTFGGASKHSSKHSPKNSSNHFSKHSFNKPPLKSLIQFSMNLDDKVPSALFRIVMKKIFKIYSLRYTETLFACRTVKELLMFIISIIPSIYTYDDYIHGTPSTTFYDVRYNDFIKRFIRAFSTNINWTNKTIAIYNSIDDFYESIRTIGSAFVE